MRRVWQALGIGLGIALLVFVLGATRLMRPVPNFHEVHYPALHILTIPGAVLESIFISNVHVRWDLHLLLAQTLSVAGNFIFYGAVAYFVIWLRSARKTNRDEAGAGWYQFYFTRRVWLALAVGLAMTVAVCVLLQMNFDRQIVNSEGGVSSTDAFPHRYELTLPGVFLIWLMILTTPVRWGEHRVLAQLVASTGNFIFYSMVAYFVMRFSSKVSAGLSARWKRQ
jgi:hypothetical protein